MNSRPAEIPQRLCLFGGSFDPVHSGHLAIAQAAVEAADLDRVVFLPAGRSPHKAGGPVAGPRQRLEMLRLALAGRPWAEISDFDLHRSPAYSIDTVRHFERAGRALYWLLGADQWQRLDGWRQPEELARRVHFLVFPRGPLEIAPRPGVRHTVVEARHPASSTRIRGLAAEGKPLQGLVPEPVAAFIRENQLYRL